MTRRALAGAICALLLAAGFAVPGQHKPGVEPPPAASSRAVPLSERVDDSPVADYRATPTTREPRAERARVRLLPPGTRQPLPPDYREIDGMPATLRRIGGCESSGRADGPLVWGAANKRSTASGAFQVLDSTWWSPKGTGWSQVYGKAVNAEQYARAMYAPPSVQLHVALGAYRTQGTGPWNSSKGCWG